MSFITSNGLANSQTRGILAQDRQLRAIMGQQLPYGGLMGADSFPGSNITYTPPKQSIKDSGILGLPGKKKKKVKGKKKN